MDNIPSYSVITSRLSRVEIKDIIDIVYCLTKEQVIQGGKEDIERRKHCKEYILGVGISNNEELHQLKYERGMPMIHIQRECQSLIQLEKRKTRRENIKNRVYFQLLQPLIWFWYGSKMKACFKLIKKGREVIEYKVFQKSTIPIPNYALVLFTLSTTTLLSYLTKKSISRSREKQYQFIEKKNEFFLIRNDVFYSRLHYYFYYFVTPYSLLGLLVFYNKKIK